MVTLLLTLIGMGGSSFEAEVGGVHIRVTVRSSEYYYNVKNVTAPPITAFEVGQYHAYCQRAPEGWQLESRGTTFRAWAERPEAAIGRGETGRFSLRVTSAGAVLGRTAVKIGFASGGPAVVAGAWGPSPEPGYYVPFTAGLVIAILLVHTRIMARRVGTAPMPESGAP